MSLDDIELSISLRLQLLMAFSTAARRNILYISTKPHSTALALYRSYSTVVFFFFTKTNLQVTDDGYSAPFFFVLPH